MMRFLWVPLAILVLGTVCFRSTDADLAISRPFFQPDTGQWPLQEVQPWKALYDWGQYPAVILGGAGLAIALAGGVCAWLRPFRKGGFFLAALLVLGPGLITNLVLKDYSGRPRPSEVTQFGGELPFRPVGDVWVEGDGKSFPCGHAAMGFYLMAPAFLCYRRRPALAAAFVAVGLLAGGMLGAARIVQGRHFASDVLWSLAIVYFTGLALHWLIQPASPPGAALPSARAADPADAPAGAYRDAA